MNKSLSHSLNALDKMISDKEHELINLKAQKQVYQTYLQDQTLQEQMINQVQQSCTLSSCPSCSTCTSGSCINGSCSYYYYPKTAYF